MRGDFSRIRFNRQQNYTAVLEQQGRVALDADANEQSFIDGYESGTQVIDVVGPYGGPVSDAGFDISIDPDSNDIGIGPGRYYVQGLLCENPSVLPSVLSYDAQPYLIGLTAPEQSGTLISDLLAAQGAQVLQLTLQVWQRLVTALDDPSLLEPAIGQADTTARLQTVWRVAAALVPAPAPEPAPAPAPNVPAGMPACCQEMYAAAVPPASTGTMSADTAGPSADCGCGPVAAAGYQGIENQLYRIEIHQGGGLASATFKWSRENGSVVTAVTAVTGMTVTVSSLGPDSNLGFLVGQWVELTDDTYQFGLTPNMPGMLHQIQAIQGLAVTLTGQAILLDTTKKARMRRWDQSGPAASDNGIALSAGLEIQLENGIQVNFSDGTYQSGDYWTIPARTATGQIEWPSGSNGPLLQPPTSVVVYSAPLSCVHWMAAPPGSDSVALAVPQDCRQTFSPLIDLAASAAPQAIHITSVSFVNDDITTLDLLAANGIQFTMDQPVTGPVSGGNVIVTIEAATGQELDLQSPAEQPTTIVRSVGVLDTSSTLVTDVLPTKVSGIAGIIVDGVNIIWQLPYLHAEGLQQLLVAYLDVLISTGAPAMWFARVRVRLIGRALFALGASSPVYLDGQVFGQPGVQADGSTQRVDLRFPSGNNAVASDFEGWFYVAPTLQILSVTLNSLGVTVVVDKNGTVTGVVDSTTGASVTPTATVNLNYAALPVTVDTRASVSLAMVGGSDVSIPESVPLTAGATAVPFDITVLRNPGLAGTVPVVANFTITATLGAAVPPSSSAAVAFTVTGAGPTTGPVHTG